MTSILLSFFLLESAEMTCKVSLQLLNEETEALCISIGGAFLYAVMRHYFFFGFNTCI